MKKRHQEGTQQRLSDGASDAKKKKADLDFLQELDAEEKAFKRFKSRFLNNQYVQPGELRQYCGSDAYCLCALRYALSLRDVKPLWVYERKEFDAPGKFLGVYYDLEDVRSDFAKERPLVLKEPATDEDFIDWVNEMVEDFDTSNCKGH